MRITQAAVSPLQVNSGDVKDDAFEPEDHKESLRERTIADAFPVAARLNTNTHNVNNH